MKKIIALIVLTGFITTSCLTMQGIKKPIILVEAPLNTTVSNNGDLLDIEDVVAFREERTNGNVKNVTLYKYPGVKVKLKKNTVLDLKSGDKKGSVQIKTKPAIGLLIFEGLFTFGIGTIVDLATGSHWVAKNRFVDVPAVLDNKTPREERELRNKVRSDFK